MLVYIGRGCLTLLEFETLTNLGLSKLFNVLPVKKDCKWNSSKRIYLLRTFRISFTIYFISVLRTAKIRYEALGYHHRTEKKFYLIENC